MKRSELEGIIEEEVYKYLAEKTIASRNPPRKMSQTQINRRDKIGKKLKSDTKAVERFKKNYGDDWESHLWTRATNLAIQKGE